jgi:hypothetical protein
MYFYNQASVEAQGKRDEMMQAAEQHRLAMLAQGEKQRFQFLKGLLSIFRRQPAIVQPKNGSRSEVNRKPASNQGW